MIIHYCSLVSNTLSYPLRQRMSPVMTHSVHLSGTFSSSFCVTRCHSGSTRVRDESRGASSSKIWATKTCTWKLTYNTVEIWKLINQFHYNQCSKPTKVKKGTYSCILGYTLFPTPEPQTRESSPVPLYQRDTHEWRQMDNKYALKYAVVVAKMH